MITKLRFKWFTNFITFKENATSSNGLTIIPLPNSPKSPPCSPEEQSECFTAASPKVVFPPTRLL